MHDDQQIDVPGCRRGISPAAVVPFPLARRRKKIITVARTLLERRTPEGRDGYWQRTIDVLARELHRHGADDATVERQLLEFYRAVDLEMARGTARSGPGGGAA